MLTHLSVQNYALLRHQEIEFRIGFSVITGETGAGKSILLGALGLILGKRADSRVLLDQSKKCMVEGTFAIANYQLESFFNEHDLDYDPLTIVRREITPQGKSRAFINDTPVTLPVLKELSSRLIDVHSQHENLNLSNGLFQLQVLDSFCGIQSQITKYQQEFKNFKAKEAELELLKEKENKAIAEKDYLNFINNEFAEAHLLPDEQLSLEEELEFHSHSEEIKSGIYEVSQILGHDEQGILTRLNSVEVILRKISAFGDSFKALSKRIESTAIELNDIQYELDSIEQRINYDPQRLEEINDRLNLIYTLQNKHRVNSIEELLLLSDQIKKQLEVSDSLSETIGELEIEIGKLKQDIKNKAQEISKIRISNFPKFNQLITNTLQHLGMPDARFNIEQKITEPGPYGMDDINYLFSANKGGVPEEISRVASGGEKSRLMLAVKSMISEKKLLPTIIFDEIDAGVSGAVAEKVGVIMKNLSSKMQVIVITHLPQIAGKGDTQYQVIKKNDDSSSSTHIRMLEDDERILEIARLLSGQEITDSSVESAKHLLKN